MARGFGARETRGPLASQVEAAAAEARDWARARERQDLSTDYKSRSEKEKALKQAAWDRMIGSPKELKAAREKTMAQLGVTAKELNEIEYSIAGALFDDNNDAENLEDTENELLTKIGVALKEAGLEYDYRFADKEIGPVISGIYNDMGKYEDFRPQDRIGTIDKGEISIDGKKYNVSIDWEWLGTDRDGNPRNDLNVRLTAV